MVKDYVKCSQKEVHVEELSMKVNIGIISC